MEILPRTTIILSPCPGVAEIQVRRGSKLAKLLSVNLGVVGYLVPIFRKTRLENWSLFYIKMRLSREKHSYVV